MVYLIYNNSPFGLNNKIFYKKTSIPAGGSQAIILRQKSKVAFIDIIPLTATADSAPCFHGYMNDCCLFTWSIYLHSINLPGD
jgi:hypothetical protein